MDTRFEELTHKTPAPGVFTSVDNLTQAITVRAEHWNSDPKPIEASLTPASTKPVSSELFRQRRGR